MQKKITEEPTCCTNWTPLMINWKLMVIAAQAYLQHGLRVRQFFPLVDLYVRLRNSTRKMKSHWIRRLGATHKHPPCSRHSFRRMLNAQEVPGTGWFLQGISVRKCLRTTLWVARVGHSRLPIHHLCSKPPIRFAPISSIQ